MRAWLSETILRAVADADVADDARCHGGIRVTVASRWRHGGVLLMTLAVTVESELRAFWTYPEAVCSGCPVYSRFTPRVMNTINGPRVRNHGLRRTAEGQKSLYEKTLGSEGPTSEVPSGPRQKGLESEGPV